MARNGDNDDRFDTFEPINHLERALVSAQNGETDTLDFMEQLAAAHVAILVDQEFASSEHPEGVRPLVLEGPDGEGLLAVFTAPARGLPMTEQNPDFAFSVEVSFAWAVNSTWEGMGVVINPGWGVGLTIPSATVSAMKGDQPKPS